MNFTPITWHCGNGHNHNVVTVDFDKIDIQRAAKVADQKVRFINAHNPGGKWRNADVIRSRIIAGKLADAAVLQFIEQEVKHQDLQWELEEYDQTRTDDFRDPDPYDLLIIKPDQQRSEIEVRSSFCYRLAPPDRMVQKLSIYGWYTSANKPVEKPHDWYWQFVYYLRPRDMVPPEGEKKWPNVDLFEDRLKNGALTGYIVGGANRQLFEDNEYASERRDQDGAMYRAIYPICNGLDCQKMLDVMLA